MASHSFHAARLRKSVEEFAFELRFEAADAAEPADLGGPSESVDHGDSELILKQLHTLRTKPGPGALVQKATLQRSPLSPTVHVVTRRITVHQYRGTFRLSGGGSVLRGSRRTTVKIAQIAPLIESVPPRLYGGTERVVSYLTEELVALGHDVTLFASGDSITAANLVPCVPKALRLDANIRDPIPYYMLMLDRVRPRAGNFDVLHFHIDQFHFPLFRAIAGRTVTTLHGRQDLPDLLPLYVGFGDMPLISISNAQRGPVPNANFAATVYHGLPAGLHRPTAEPRGGYVAFLGRISPEKRPDRAISIARALGIPLKIAAKVDRVDEVYYLTQIEPLLDGPGVEFICEINEHQKTQFLGEAQALLFTGRLAGAI